MITRIALENFKCFRKVEVNPRLITVFVGPNGSGKSSVLQAMALLKQSVGGLALNFAGRLLKLSSPADITPRFSHSSITTRIEFSGSVKSTFIDSDVLGFGESIEYSYSFASLERTGVTAHSGELQFEYQGDLKSLKVSNSGQVTAIVQIGDREPTLKAHNLIARLVAVDWPDDKPEPLLQDALIRILDTPNSVVENGSKSIMA